MILIIDNYDSFTYNLYQRIGEIIKESGKKVKIQVIRNDELEIDEIKNLNPEKIIISPGPGNPTNKRDFGICSEVIQKFHKKIPILGICLGHQGIFVEFGGKLKYSTPVHGKISMIKHNGSEIFKGVKNPFRATRYHSIICDPKTIPDCIEVTAMSKDVIMGIKHKKYPVFGIQFHPESIGTKEGKTILKNFLMVD